MQLDGWSRYPAYPSGYSARGYDDDPDSHFDILFRSHLLQAPSAQAIQGTNNGHIEDHPAGGDIPSAAADSFSKV